MVYQEKRRMQQPEQVSIPMVQHALAYAESGWLVFPLAENGKIPLRNSHGLLEATTDPILIEAAWASNQNLNIGLRTGKESGIIILDIDPRHKGNANLEVLQRRYGKLPSTRLSRTPRGGIHRYFQHPRDGQEYGNAIELDKLSGLDVRGEGGYCVLPPSTLFGGKANYKFVKEDFPIAKAPEWLLGLIKRSRNEVPPQERVFPPSKGDRWLEEGLHRASLGNRNATLFWISQQCRDDGLSQGQTNSIALAFVSQVIQGEHPFTEREALITVASAYRRSPRQPARRRS